MQLGSQYHRFDPITVRAAARLVYMRRSGRLSEWEVRYYLRELAATAPNARPGGSRGLRRLAERLAALGRTGTPAATRLRRRVPVRGQGRGDRGQGRGLRREERGERAEGNHQRVTGP